ncbi:MAG: PorT family protein, partial [Candidatus Saccharicenans sp.]|nr:PorT family protein [Candidatus Saccharicenans sp.]
MKRVMKNLSVVLASLFLLSLLVNPALAGVKFGVKGGITLANVKSVPDTFEGYSWETKMGLAGGISMEIGLPGPFSIQPEVLYVQKGAKISFSEEGITGTFKANIDYIEIPVLLKYNLVTGGLTRPSVYVGPYFGFNTSAKFVLSVTGYPDQTEDIKDDIKNTEFGAVFGVGLTQKLGLFRITLDARYDLGLSNILE